MKIVFAVSEMQPFAKTGGLADVAGSLSAALQGLGHEVAVFLPRYKTVDVRKLELKNVLDRFEVPVGSDKEGGRLWERKLENGVRVFFIDHPEFFNRDAFYGTPHGDYPDNDRRFIFFQRAIFQCLKGISFKPDMMHCHDWQTGLIPVYLKTLYASDPFFQKTKSVFTVHNLGYQGNFPPDSLPATGLGWEHFRLERLEFYGKVSFLKGGLVDGDAVTTVSERYAQEIQTQEFGCGLEGVLARRRESLYGVLNGIDLEEWNPETDRDITAHFSAAKVDKKAANKAALQKENSLLLAPQKPLIGMVTRLVDQKGLDILIPALGPMMQMGVQFVLLGTGEEKYHHVLRDFARKNRGQCGVHILFDAKMAKHIYAGSDMMLMPSYYEPCGLGQMIALRFGSIPVVRETGGLADTIRNFDPRTGAGNGFSFREYTPEALLDSVERALKVYENKEEWQKLVRNAMGSDFSWDASAKRYGRIYETTKRRPIGDLK